MTRRLLAASILFLSAVSGVSAQVPSPRRAVPEARATALANSNALDTAAEYQIGPEDVLDISVWKNPELSRTVPVRPDGKVSLPLLNDFRAAGLTPSDLREQLVSRLSDFVPTPEVSVIVREVHSRKVAVVGAVKTAGRYELKSPMTVLEAIALAQGFTDFAARDRIVVLRQSGGTTTRIPFNYRKIADGAEQENFFVRPGDIVVVP
jgi:polysaccharide biosynthesis/export protein